MTAVWRTSLVVTTAAVTAAALGGCQRSEAAPPPISAPMLVVNHRPVVDAEVINGDGEAHPVRMLIDTGGTGVVFTPEAAKRTKLAIGKRQRLDDGLYGVASLKALRIGKTRLEISGLDPLVAIETTSDGLRGADGLIGSQVLSRYGRVTLNFPAEQLVLGESDTAPTLGTLVPTTFDNGFFTARITLGNETHRLLVDTGSVTTHIREGVSIRITGTRQGVWGRVVLAPFEVVSDPEELLARGRGLLGGNLLERFTVRINYDRKTLRISTT